MDKKFLRFKCESCGKINMIPFDDFQRIKIGSKVLCKCCKHVHYKVNHAIIESKKTISPYRNEKR